MNSRHYHSYRFARRLGESVKCPAYASAIEKPAPSLWKRIATAIREVLQ